MLYVGELLAVAVHEVLGHGLAALCLGGEFTGFTIRWDGYGFACAYMGGDASVWHEIVMLSAGICVNFFFGIFFLALALMFRKRLFLRLSLLVFSIMAFLEAAAYLFWNAYHPIPPGDIGRILAETDNGLWRFLAMGFGGVAGLAVTFLLNALIFQGAEQWMGQDKPLIGFKKIIALTVLIVVPGSMWFIFDWDLLAPGLGLLPSVAGVICQLIVAILLYWFSFKVDGQSRRLGQATKPIIIAWVLLGITILSMWLWFSKGVNFGSEGTGEFYRPVLQVDPPPAEELFLRAPGFAPDGNVLACTLRGGHYSAPLLLDVPTFKPRPLIRLQGSVEGWYGFSWRPDGKEFVFTLVEKESDGTILGFAVWLFDVQTNEARPLARPSDKQLFQYPLFAPDGGSVLFREALGCDLFLYDVASGKTNRLTSSADTFRLAYAWGVDNNVVLTSVGYRDKGVPGLLRISTKDKSCQKISSIKGVYVLKPSPDGNILACLIDTTANEVEEEHQLALFNILDSTRRNLARTDHITMAWSPDSGAIAYCKGDRIWVYDLTTSKHQSRTPESVKADFPFWNPKDNTLWCVVDRREIACVNPDGLEIMFSLDKTDPTTKPSEN
jgi:Tol biopolymer transport system component